MKVSKITVARLYNLGSYEHVRYELTVDVGKGESAQKALVNLEKILDALSHRGGGDTDANIACAERRVADFLTERNKIGDAEFKRKHGYFEGTPLEYIARLHNGVEEAKTKRAAYKERHAQARKLLDDLGGDATWKDSKLEWEE